MSALRLRPFGRKQRIAAGALLTISLGSWFALRGNSQPSYGGRPSKSLDFTLPEGTSGAKNFSEQGALDAQPLSGVKTAKASSAIAKANAETVDASARVFVSAIVANDAVAAYQLLTSADQTFYGSPEQFAATLARSAPWNDANVTVVGSSIVATVERTPQLDDALGLITPVANVTLPAIVESGEWRIDWRNRNVDAEPTLDAQKASADVLLWAEGRRSCKPDPTREHATGLVGVEGFAAALCNAKGELSVGSISLLETLDDPGPFVDAFGPDVLRWGRVVTIRTPIDMRVVVAPVGDRWVAVGLARPEYADEVPAG
jgi:hypothetical protein